MKRGDLDVWYLAALLFPPLACLGVGKFGACILNTLICLTIVGIPLAMMHAWYVVKEADRDKFGGRVVVVK